MIHMPHWPKILGQKLGLDRMMDILNDLGNPQDKTPPIVHISGSNGKGSTLAFLKAIMESSGYKVHRYTSPHLVFFNERIHVASKDIDDKILFNILEECRIATGNREVTFFEGTTIAAFLAFSKIEADIVLLETGLGGRLDATNIIKNPILNIISSISMEHTEYLGNNLTDIAKEKAGIMRENTPCVISFQQEESMQSLMQYADKNRVPLFRYGYEWDIQRLSDGFLYREGEASIKLPHPSLIGLHQYINAGNAVASAYCLKEYFSNISNDTIKKGIETASWKGRMQNISHHKLFKNINHKESELWIDGAHNIDGMSMLNAQLDIWNEDKKNNILIVGFTKGRNIKAILSPVINNIDYVFTIRVRSEPSAYHENIIADQVKELGINVDPCNDLLDAISKINIKFGKEKIRVIICGSLYLYSDLSEIK